MFKGVYLPGAGIEWTSQLIPGEGRSHITIHQASSTFLGSFGRTIIVAGISLVAVCAALAEPVTYTGFTITDGKLGNWSFHNARVYLMFKSDTTNVQFMQPLDPCNAPLERWMSGLIKPARRR